MPTMTKPASPKQLAFLAQLAEERNYPLPEITTSGEASRMIDWLMGQPKVKKAPAAPSGQAVTEPGMYCAPDGSVVKVQLTKDKQRMYAKAMVDSKGERLNLLGDIVHFEFVYTPGLMQHLTADMRMTKEQAADFGLRTGRCMWCRKELKLASSILAGMGAICAKNFG